MTNTEKFRIELERAYTHLFQSDPDYAYAASRNTPQGLAEKTTSAFMERAANKDGKGVKIACKTLGIKHTYKGIFSFLSNDDAMEDSAVSGQIDAASLGFKARPILRLLSLKSQLAENP
jgi:hypothetical protein